MPEDLADLEPEEQQKRIKPMPWMPRNHVAATDVFLLSPKCFKNHKIIDL